MKTDSDYEIDIYNIMNAIDYHQRRIDDEMAFRDQQKRKLEETVKNYLNENPYFNETATYRIALKTLSK